MNVREATISDVPALEVVRRQAIEAGFSDEYDRAAFADLVASADDRLPVWVDDPEWLVLVSESEVTPVGFGALDTATGEIGALYTTPEHEGKGSASTILKRFEQRARTAALDLLHATVPRNAVGFFERQGFDRLGTVDGAIQRVRVSKPLA